MKYQFITVEELRAALRAKNEQLAMIRRAQLMQELSQREFAGLPHWLVADVREAERGIESFDCGDMP